MRYKNGPGISAFTNFGTCEDAQKIDEYLTSPYCHEAEVIYRSIKPPIKFSHQTPLIDVIEKLADDKDLKQVIQLFLESDASVNDKSDSGWIPLHEAA